jgi:hypothetical protein
MFTIPGTVETLAIVLIPIFNLPYNKSSTAFKSH